VLLLGLLIVKEKKITQMENKKKESKAGIFIAGQMLKYNSNVIRPYDISNN
jgi:hypothetical protein